MKYVLCAIVALTAALFFSALANGQKSGGTRPEKPSVMVKIGPPEAVPIGACKQNRSGYLEHADTHNRLTPYTPVEIQKYLAERIGEGYVVSFYPQPHGKLWVEAVCPKI
jgi:hypothetical protein